jgi:acetyltransferase-like isoleucine patch superfamily enzyme
MTLGSIDALVDLVAERIFSQARVHGPEDRLHLPKGFAGNDALFNTRCGDITIGKGTHFGHGVRVLTGAHIPTDPAFPLDPKDRSIVIGENCWLASYCIILGPCKIGDGCVIGAGAVVTKDCEAGYLYGGNPAKKIKRV